jgi:orotidine-5'-phosphate decarboxylase
MLEESVAATMNTEIKIFGVTALTSLSDTDTNFIYKREAKEQVLAMIDLAKKSSIMALFVPHKN